MKSKVIHAVTGAFGYSGKYITQRLLAEGQEVITLTNSPHRRNPFGEAVQAFPFNFDHPDKLAESLKGVSVLYNTYWVRFNHKTFTHADAVRNTKVLFEAAKDAVVQRIIHISITNPAKDSPAVGTTKLTEWAAKHSSTLGLKYTSELARRRDRHSGYKSN